MIDDILTLLRLFLYFLVRVVKNLGRGVQRAYVRWRTKATDAKPLTLGHFMPSGFVGRMGLRTYGVILFIVWLVLFLTDAPMQAFMSNTDPATKRLFATITDWGKSDWFLILSGVYFFVCCTLAIFAVSKFFKVLWVQCAAWLGAIFLSVALSGIAVQFFKMIFGRLRPGRAENYEGFNFHPFAFDSAYTSMPSGHSTTAFSFAIMAMFLMPRLKWPLLIFALLIIISRVVVSAHYPSDVYLGALLGTAFAVIIRHWMANRGLIFQHSGTPPQLRGQIGLKSWGRNVLKRWEKTILKPGAEG